MFQPPDLSDETLIARLREAYGLPLVVAAFLPLGADPNSAVYRAVAEDGAAYFVKLRRAGFDELSVLLPRWLGDQGIPQIIAPLATLAGQLWTRLDGFTAILYPFVVGRSGYEVALSERHWREFGSALRRIHTAAVPTSLAERIRRETFSPQGRAAVRMFLSQPAEALLDEPVARRLAAFLQARRAEILDLVGRAERLAEELRARTPPFVVCHSDAHAGNVLIDDDRLFIVDWDDPVLAPKERDLMFPGGAQGFRGHTAQEEEELFYRGYGQVEVDPVALAYYRYERIVQDIAAFCEQLFLTAGGGDDREQSLRYLMSNFLPGNTIEVAYASDRTSSRPGRPADDD